MTGVDEEFYARFPGLPSPVSRGEFSEVDDSDFRNFEFRLRRGESTLPEIASRTEPAGHSKLAEIAREGTRQLNNEPLKFRGGSWIVSN